MRGVFVFGLAVDLRGMDGLAGTGEPAHRGWIESTQLAIDRGAVAVRVEHEHLIDDRRMEDRAPTLVGLRALRHERQTEREIEPGIVRPKPEVLHRTKPRKMDDEIIPANGDGCDLAAKDLAASAEAGHATVKVNLGLPADVRGKVALAQIRLAFVLPAEPWKENADVVIRLAHRTTISTVRALGRPSATPT